MKVQTKSTEPTYTVWFGDMENIQFSVGSDSFNAIIVNQINMISCMTEQEADDFMWEFGHDSYLIPDKFPGQILFGYKRKP